MSAVPFDTLKYLETLKEAGISEEQARALTTGLAEAVDMNLATKQDIKDVRRDMEAMESRLIIKLGSISAASVFIAIAIVSLL